MEKRKLDSLVLLRALAVLAVCFCHFGNPLESDSAIGRLFTLFHDYGKYGVQIFFVVSGFVIPLSLQASKYTINNYFRFLWKRTLRLHPPYLVALGLTLILSYFSYRVRGIANPETPTSILQSLFYFHHPIDNPVFWTLAVEAQYYIFIGVAYVLIISNPRASLLILIPLALLGSQSPVSQYITLFTYLTYFLIGIIGFLIYQKVGSLLLNVTGIFALLGYTAIFDDVAGSIAAFIATTFILFYNRSVPTPVSFIGEISYSIYLIHFPLGIKIINLTNRYIDISYNYLLFPLTTVLIIIISWFYYKIIEKPSANLSSKIKYNTPNPVLTPAPTPVS